VRAPDRAVGIVLGILLGLAIVIGFLFLGSRDAIDEPSISGGRGAAPAQTQTAPQPGQGQQQATVPGP
jgi:hypothetical protein